MSYQTTGPIGYVVAINYGDARGWQIDWDGEVHPTVEAALAECMEANGEEWASDVRRDGLASNIRGADYLPYALTLALPGGAA
ncbi:MAG TPA: hypothetical protein VFH56_11185 [Acidimicrobiales bacterium]|nr:hypothetical protein [Acidimicrobiales bacterium]